MSTLKRTVPTVTYALLSYFENKINNRKNVEIFRNKEKEKEEMLRKVREANEKRLAEKKALIEEVHRTHVVPFWFFEKKREEKKELARLQEKARNDAILNQLEIDRLEKGFLRQVAEKVERRKRYGLEIGKEKIIPIRVKQLLSKYEERRVDDSEVTQCEKNISLILADFGRTIGFAVIKKEQTDCVELTFRKPFPYHSL
jgi:hypothetical protein